MAVAILIAAIGLMLIAFALQEFFDPERRKYASVMIRATTIAVIGLYMLKIYSELEPNSAGGSNYGKPFGI
jgi:formate hydrogenlyase subunit 3/multisubunit Na+/H+ antiporter MnhD subunit